jgi:DNA (cytosine-5)-methyltransferase 1
MRRFNYIDLFAGAGGLSEGFIRAGYTPVAHIEMDEAACYTLKTRIAYHYLKSQNKYSVYIKYLKGEISRSELYTHVPSKLLNSVINQPIGPESNRDIYNRVENLLGKGKIDLIIGGPPCQAYSLVGRARSDNGMEKDPRNYLYVQYAKYLERYKPKMFVFENVLGLKSAGSGKYLKNMENLFFEKGYSMKLFTVEANNFGVLQNRRRIIIIGWESSLSPKLPDLEQIKITSEFKVNDLLSDLPKVLAGQGIDKFTTYFGPTNKYLKNSQIRNGIDILTQHVARQHTVQDKEIYRIAVNQWNNEGTRLDYNTLPDNLKTHANRTSFIDRFKVVAADKPYTHTVVAHISKDGHYYIHPDIEQNRSITVREAARLQSFPDDYYFEGVKEGSNRTASFKQIGNAVPPLLSWCIAKILVKIL